MGLAQKRFTGKKGFICSVVFVLLVSCSLFSSGGVFLLERVVVQNAILEIIWVVGG